MIPRESWRHAYALVKTDPSGSVKRGIFVGVMTTISFAVQDQATSKLKIIHLIFIQHLINKTNQIFIVERILINMRVKKYIFLQILFSTRL